MTETTKYRVINPWMKKKMNKKGEKKLFILFKKTGILFKKKIINPEVVNR